MKNLQEEKDGNKKIEMQYNNTIYIISSLGRRGSSLLDNSIRESNLKNNRNNYF